MPNLINQRLVFLHLVGAAGLLLEPSHVHELNAHWQESIHKQVHISLNSKDFKVKYSSVPIPPNPNIPSNVTPLIAHSNL